MSLLEIDALTHSFEAYVSVYANDFTDGMALHAAKLIWDNLAESVYRRLMVCQRESGDPAGALTTYRRCRELLSIVLSRPPSPETEAIRQTL